MRREERRSIDRMREEKVRKYEDTMREEDMSEEL